MLKCVTDQKLLHVCVSVCARVSVYMYYIYFLNNTKHDKETTGAKQGRHHISRRAQERARPSVRSLAIWNKRDANCRKVLVARTVLTTQQTAQVLVSNDSNCGQVVWLSLALRAPREPDFWLVWRLSVIRRQSLDDTTLRLRRWGWWIIRLNSNAPVVMSFLCPRRKASFAQLQTLGYSIGFSPLPSWQVAL